jgi:hypothetical protein
MKALLAVIASLLAAPVLAQSDCASRESAERQLQSNHGEGLVMYGVTSSGAVLQIWVNRQTGTWTAVITDGSISCIATHGVDAELLQLPPNL